MTIKRFPADFCVEEALTPELLSRVTDVPGTHVLWQLEKTGLTTPDAAAMVARELRLPGKDVQYAGLKDKHALTRQYVSTRWTGREATDPPAKVSGKSWSLERVGWLGGPLTTSGLLGNRFRITVRDLTGNASRRMAERAELLQTQGEGDTRALLIVNYFGEQRFGSARHGEGFLARSLIKGRFEEALRLAIATEARKDSGRQKALKRALRGKWGRWKELFKELPRGSERTAIEVLARRSDDFRGAFQALPYFLQQMAVQAYQSYLWNQIAARLVETSCSRTGGNMLREPGKFGELCFPEAGCVTADVRRCNLPVLGYKTVLSGAWKDSAGAVLEVEGISTSDLRIPGVRRPFFGEAPRPLFVSATEFGLSEPQAETDKSGRERFARTLTFVLPRGAYGTVVLRALGQ